MRKTCILTALALLLAATTAGAGIMSVGVSAFGGVSIPVVNDLSEQGSQFGIRVPVRFTPLISAEAFYEQGALGDVTDAFEGPVSYTRDGGDLSGFGANALFSFGSPGFSFFPFVGFGSYKITRSGAEDISELGYQFGLGLGFAPAGLKGVSFDVRGEFLVVATDQTSQKFGNITGGVSYKLFSTP